MYLGAGNHHHSKSVGEGPTGGVASENTSLKRMLKKNTSSTGQSSSKSNMGLMNHDTKASTRPSSGQKKRLNNPGGGSNSAQGHYDQAS